MVDKKAYDDGSLEYAVEVMKWFDAAQSMLYIHGGTYTGRKMVEVSAK
jgi:hypothetical protein